MKKIIRSLVFVIANIGFSQAVYAECDMWSEPIDHQSIKVHYDVTSCDNVAEDKAVKLCLKKADAFLGTCIKGKQNYTRDKKGSYIFSGLSEGTKYRIKGLYLEKVWGKKLAFWKKFDRIKQATNKQNVQCIEKTAALTGNTKKIDASGIFHASFPSWKAFDKDPSSMWQSKIWEAPAWISYQWATPQIINQYSITFPNEQMKRQAPKDWELQGWDGEEWITVDSRHNQTKWGGKETRIYTVATPGNYKKYRLHFTDDNDFRKGILAISIGDLSLKSCEQT